MVQPMKVAPLSLLTLLEMGKCVRDTTKDQFAAVFAALDAPMEDDTRKHWRDRFECRLAIFLDRLADLCEDDRDANYPYYISSFGRDVEHNTYRYGSSWTHNQVTPWETNVSLRALLEGWEVLSASGLITLQVHLIFTYPPSHTPTGRTEAPR